MPIVFAAVVPHSPLLVPTIAKGHARLLTQTSNQLESLGAELYARQPEVVVFLTPHGPTITGQVVAHVAERYQGDLKAFGDLTTHLDAPAAPQFTHLLQRLADNHQLPLRLQTDPSLDYGTTVPGVRLLAHLSAVAILPITVAGLSTDQLIRLARVISDASTTSQQRLALIATADLSRRSISPASTLSPRPTALERQLSTALTEVDPATVPVTEPADCCGWAPIFVLVQVLHGLADHGRVESFEAPLGVGLLTASFTLT